MIRLLVRLATWLDNRFPEKLVVKADDYFTLLSKVGGQDVELSVLRSDLKEARQSIDVLVSRIGSAEKNSAHVDAVRFIVAEVKKLRDEYASLKTSLGLNRVAQSSPVAEAFLNDIPLGAEYGE